MFCVTQVLAIESTYIIEIKCVLILIFFRKQKNKSSEMKYYEVLKHLYAIDMVMICFNY